MDVNGTILWNDSIMGLGPDELLLGTMFGFTEVRPRSSVPFTVTWGEELSVEVTEKLPLKEMLHQLTDGDDRVFHDFWKQDICRAMLEQVTQHADLGWTGKPGTVSIDDFFAVYLDYMAELYKQDKEQGAAACGITESWFRCCTALREGHHAPVINSFGMDTQRVVVRSARDPRRSPHFAINFEMWSERDSNKFKAQFSSEALPPAIQTSPPPSPRTQKITRAVAPRNNSMDSPFIGDHSGEVLQKLEGVHAFDIILRKHSPDMPLGAEVRHMELGLEIVQVLEEGAIIEANQLNLSMRPPWNAIKIGDVILQVNSVRGDTRAMIQECRLADVTMLVLRRPFKELDFHRAHTEETEPMGQTTGMKDAHPRRSRLESRSRLQPVVSGGGMHGTSSNPMHGTKSGGDGYA